MASTSKEPTKRKRNVLSISDKIEIINRLKRGESREALMNFYNIGSSTLYDIKSNKDKLLEFASKMENDKFAKTKKTMHKAKLEQLDCVLYEWFLCKRSEGMPITGPIIIEKAKYFYTALKVTEQCVFSDGWLARFKSRHGIRKLDISGEKKSADAIAASDYCTKFKEIVEKYHLTREQVYNADETGLLWRCLPNSTLAGAGEAAATGFKHNKQRLTILCCANAAGTHRLELLVIGKYARPRALKNISGLPVIYKSQSNAWMNREIFHDWFKSNFIPSVKSHFTTLDGTDNQKCLLLLDNCRAHPSTSELVSDCGNFIVLCLPPNVTSLIQPMDQGIIQNFKCLFKKQFLRKLIAADSVKSFQQSYNIKDALFNAAFAWTEVKCSTLANGWNKLWFNDNQTLSNNNAPYDEICEILNSNAKQFGDIQEHEIADWLHLDDNTETVQTFTDEQLIESVLNPNATENLSSGSDEDVQVAEKGITWQEAEAGLKTFFKFAEQCSQYSAQEVMQIYVMQNNFLVKKEKSTKQLDIRSWLLKNP